MATKFEILVTRNIPKAALQILESRCNIDHWNKDDAIPKVELLKRIKNKEGVFCLLTDQINKEVLDSAGDKLQVVSTMSVGVDHIDLNECKKRKIAVGYTPDILTSATAEFTVGLLLTTSRRIIEGTKSVADGSWGTWKPMWMCGPTLEDSTVGFFGLGRIGQALVSRLRPFGVKNFLFNTLHKKSGQFEKEVGGKWVKFDELLLKSDFLICCAALTPTTTGIFNKETFSKMKSSSIFINISRGGIVQQDDLYEALTHDVIRAAGIDVTNPEPLPTNHPLLQLPNCVVTPHIGSATDETRTNMAVLAATNLLKSLQNLPMDTPYKL